MQPPVRRNQQHQDQWVRLTEENGEQADPGSGGRAEHAPQHLFDPELVDRQG